MEPAEYGTLFEMEERYWWYRGLRRLAAEQARQALRCAGGRRACATGVQPLGLRILDAGCGAGGMLTRLRDLGPCWGIDFSPLALRLARRRGGFPLFRGSVTHLPFRDASFDLAVSLDVLYHRGVTSDLEALREIRRCLRPGGTLVLNLPAFESLRSSHDAAIHTARRYRRGPLRMLLEQAGLHPVRITYWNTLLFPGLALIRLLRRGRTEAASDLDPLPDLLNRLLEAILTLERFCLRRADLPFGLSLMAVARRPEETP